MTPPAKAGGFSRSSTLQQRLLHERTGYCPTLAVQGPIQADDGKTVGMHLCATPHDFYPLQGLGSGTPRSHSAVKVRVAPVEAAPSAIEAGRQEQVYQSEVDMRLLRVCGPTPFTQSPKGDGPLEWF
jgi:hypothetical protein